MKNEFSKESFIEVSSNSSLPVMESQVILNGISISDFMEFDSETYPIKLNKSSWNEEYFRSQLSLIQRKEFSKQRCEHIINVKHHLQHIGAVGFDITSDQYTSPSTKKTQPTLNSDDRSQEISTSSIKTECDIEELPDILKNYQPTEKLQIAVSKKDIRAIQNIIKFDLKNNRLLIEDIIQEVVFINKHTSDVFVDYYEDKFCLAIDENKESWNKDYFLLQQSYLNHNFAMERLMHLINVRDYLAKKGVEGFEYIRAKPTSQTQANKESKKKHQSNRISSSSLEYNKSSSDRSRSNTGQSSQKKQEDGFIKTAMKIGGAVLEHIRALLAKLR
ncbi:hypothetical protein [Psychrobacter submarinus]|uniref:hypothetical protein n=1 Tax=Psychrobacter submarinus TaxID=154108 RepID=UPI0019190D0E|nr:hypothetical protein [Psychrobacter submarinus]